MKVLAAIVVPPHLSMSGGARAAERLSAALAGHCTMTVASMMHADVSGLGNTVGAPRRVDVRCWLPPLLPWSRLPNRYRTLFYRSSIPAIISSGAFDLVHIHNPMPALEMLRVAQACRAKGIPYVVSTHGFNEVWNGGAVYGFDIARRLVWSVLVQQPVARVVKHASGVFALSPADVPIVRGMGFEGTELIFVPNGVDVPPADEVGQDREILLGRGISPERQPGQITCMFLANHTPNKGVTVLLEAFSSLDRPYLLIVGGEKRQEVDYEKYLRRCRRGQEIVVTGRLTDAEVSPLLRRSDLFVFPTLADTFPLVVLEAFAAGVPVLGTGVEAVDREDADFTRALLGGASLAAALDAAGDGFAFDVWLVRALQARRVVNLESMGST